MARSKSKRSHQTPAKSSKPVDSGRTPDSQPDLNSADSGNCHALTKLCPKGTHQPAATTAVLEPCKGQPSPSRAKEAKEVSLDDPLDAGPLAIEEVHQRDVLDRAEFDSLLTEQTLEVALNQVDQWMTEARDQASLKDDFEQRLERQSEPTASPTQLFSQFDGILSDYRESLRDQEREHAAPASLSEFDVSTFTRRIEENLSTIENRLEMLMVSFDSKMNRCCSELLRSFDESLAGFKTATAQPQLPAAENRPRLEYAASSESSWESRKRQMLSEFGMSSEEIEQIVPVNAKVSTSTYNHPKPERVSSADSLEALHHSIETLDKIDSVIHSAEIEQLKEQLTAQLREAEVELSINRARLSKEWAALEQRASELSQREAAFKSKYNAAESASKKGLLDRITRHLSRKT